VLQTPPWLSGAPAAAAAPDAPSHRGRSCVHHRLRHPLPRTRTRSSLRPQRAHTQHKACSPLPSSRAATATVVPCLRSSFAQAGNAFAFPTSRCTSCAPSPVALVAGARCCHYRHTPVRLRAWPAHCRPPRGKPRPPLGAHEPHGAPPPSSRRRQASLRPKS
jgi:hypothetical protein